MCTARTGGQGMMERGGREISCGAICLSSAGPRSAYLHQPMRVKGKKKSSPPSPLTHSKTLSFFLSFGGNIRHNIFSFFFPISTPHLYVDDAAYESLVLSFHLSVRSSKKRPSVKERESDFYLSLFKYSCDMISAALVWWWWR